MTRNREKYLCLECEVLLEESELLEPAWYRGLPPEQQALESPPLACPYCVSADGLMPLSDLRRQREKAA